MKHESRLNKEDARQRAEFMGRQAVKVSLRKPTALKSAPFNAMMAYCFARAAAFYAERVLSLEESGK